MTDQHNSTARIAVVGGGQAGAQAIASLRLWGHTGPITLISEEPVPPYQRPPLSKAYLKGDLAEERLYFKPTAWYQDNNVDLVLGTRVTALDLDASTIRIEHGGHIDYDVLILATGSRPRPLPVAGAELRQVYDLRSISDVERIRPRLIARRKLLIVGAGYIGLEAAASARQLGLNVTVIEMAPRVLARVTSPPVSEFYEQQHRAQGVVIHTDARLESLRGDDGVVSTAQLADGTVLPADLVLAGIGIVPNQELAQDAGIQCADGIVVDRDGRTSAARVFAAGDCTRRPLLHYDRAGRLESVHNAIEQGKLVAAAIVGRDRPEEVCPWFWSDQYDLKLQTVGLSGGHDQAVLRGNPEERKFAVFYLLKGRLIAVDAINSPREFMVSKQLIAAGASIAPQLLGDTTVSIKDIAASAAT